MKLQQLDEVKQILGFFSMTIAWTLMNIVHSTYLAWEHGKADDSGVVIFWSGLFITIAWAIFIIYPINRVDHSKLFFRPYILPIITGFYGVLVYSLIVGVLFRSIDLLLMFIPWAFLTGLIFGIAYSVLIKQEKLISVLFHRSLARAVFIFSPVVIWLFFLWVLPNFAPSIAFRYMPDEIRYKIVARTIPRFKVGDDFELLKKALPGYFDFIDNGSGNTFQIMENFGFVLQVHCNKIIRLEFGREQTDFDGTIYGELQEEPCL